LAETPAVEQGRLRADAVATLRPGSGCSGKHNGAPVSERTHARPRFGSLRCPAVGTMSATFARRHFVEAGIPACCS
jgi:hypothetical protein